MMRKIVRYSKALQDAFGFKTKPESWMHLAISISKADGGSYQVFAAIYVWDTREVIETCRDNVTEANLKRRFDKALKEASPVKDSHEPLKGKDAASFNADFRWKEAATEAFTPEQRANVYDSCYSKCKGYALDIANAMRECLLAWAKEHNSKASIVSVKDIQALVADALNSGEGAIARGAKR